MVVRQIERRQDGQHRRVAVVHRSDLIMRQVERVQAPAVGEVFNPLAKGTGGGGETESVKPSVRGAETSWDDELGLNCSAEINISSAVDCPIPGSV